MFRAGYRLASIFLVTVLFGLGSFAVAQDANADANKGAAAPPQGQGNQQVDPLKRPIGEKQKKENAKALKQELGKTYKKWLDEDVRWIISDEERAAFKQLSNDEERDQFIEGFWQRRDPTPDTVENEFKEEHYARIAYANEHFAAGIPGWKTDRGRIYIMYGKADEVESHPSGGQYERPMEEGGGSTSTFPFEQWRYRYLEGVGQEVIIEFVDTCMCGDYHMTMDRSEKDALLMTPNGGLTQYEQMGMSSKAERFSGAGIERLGRGPFSNDLQTKQFDRLEQWAKLNKPPTVKFKDLEEIVSHKISVNLMPFDVRADFVRVTGDTVLVPVTIQVKNRDVTFVNKDGVQRGTINIFGRVTTLTGRIAQTFEDTVQMDIPAELLPREAENSHVYWKALPLRPGRYRFDVVVKDVNGDRSGSWSRGVQVPDYAEDKLASSSLIVADNMEPVAAKNVGTGMFVIGTTKVRPRVASADGKPVMFKRNQKLNFWMQIYNLGVDEKTHKPSATIEYDVTNAATNKQVIRSVESTEQMGNVGDQMTLQKTLSAANLGPGIYRIKIKVNDNISKQTVDPSATFAVE
ncbi:MAG: GWxTD domain-containing protein [Acidobacteria bacterium]|nr:MAG: GWxTD domain-containing protein [Acidobacteriales bacterium 13_1_40CM_3_55_5]PYX03665.1 MAG: GWxTD domain-containing protein [Acidobacteriota bacterium]PYX15391.1 MAG: GWxTD domain-containing protein [Acidobacteriota bacterium]